VSATEVAAPQQALLQPYIKKKSQLTKHPTLNKLKLRQLLINHRRHSSRTRKEVEARKATNSTIIKEDRTAAILGLKIHQPKVTIKDSRTRKVRGNVSKYIFSH